MKIIHYFKVKAVANRQRGNVIDIDLLRLRVVFKDIRVKAGRVSFSVNIFKKEIA